MRRARTLVGTACWAALGLFAAPATASEVVAPDVRRVALIGGPEDPDLRPRAPVLVRRGDELVLRFRTPEDERRARWLPGGVLASAVAIDATSEHLADELDLEALPDADTISSSRWRNGRLLVDGEPVGWCPSLARDAEGAAHLAYDRHDRGDFDVVYRDPVGAEWRVAGTRAFEADASVAPAPGGGALVAWSEGPPGFGRGGGLHAARELRLAVVRDGSVVELALPEDLLEGATGRASEGFSLAELPRLVLDERGPVWLLVRTMARWKRVEQGGRRGSPDTGSNRRVVWEWRAAALTDAGWTRTVTLPASDGPGYDGLAAVALDGGGVAVAYEADGRLGEFPRAGLWESSLSGDALLVAVELRVDADAPTLPTEPARPAERVDPEGPGALADPAPELVPEGLVRLWGDLHRHSDLSRCKMDEDGNQLAQYRYALEVGGLDFLGISEHYQHLSPAHWDYAREMVERFDRPGEFAALFGFEQAQKDGHRNLFCADPDEAVDAPFREWKPARRWAPFPPRSWIAIPHQLVDPKVPLQWPRQWPAIECAVEIYQSRRGSYFSRDDALRAFHAERGHPHALDYLAEGRSFGVVAASDHVTSSSAFTAVLSTERTRDAMFDALRARRTYAATAKMAVDLRLGELGLGEEGAVARDAPLVVRVAAGGELARVEVLRRGEVVHVWAGESERRLLVVRLGGDTRDPRLRLRLDDASWVGEPRPFRSTTASTLLVTEEAVHLDGDLEAYGECGLIGTVELGAEPALHLERERAAESVPLSPEPAGPVLLRVGTARAEVRLDPAPLGTDRLDVRYEPGDWRPGDWVQVRVVRADGEMAWTSPIRIAGGDG